jgi:hypothetical protein
MKTFKNQAAQGDCLVTRIDTIPVGLKPMELENDVYVVAHSETGHHHVLQQGGVNVFEAANDPFVLYLVVDKPVELKHLRSFDTHESLRINPGKYRINRQREYTAEGFRRAAD